ncbi:MAG: hypothetical protein A2017_20050 [Lentisphaerae bacterium GWF2_44_16]|nr:MAG: hypothetical protein A2017_20050 [Lentisphaerae bacterium GWF2_44_16]
MEIKYHQLSLSEALKTYGDWLLEQQIDKPVNFFRCYEGGNLKFEWYMIFYPVRTLLLCGKIFKQQKYIDAAFKYVDIYISEQLPNGGFTSNYRQKNTEQLSKKEFHELLRSGKINIADVGSNATAIIQAAAFADKNRKEKYLESARKWLDNWVPIWALKDGGYGNGIWVGHKLNSPYTCAMSTVVMALSAFTQATGESEYIENAERCMDFQCSKWLDDGRPVFMDCYPLPNEKTLDDFGHSFYLLEGMCWTHFVSQNSYTRNMIASRMRDWIFGERGLLKQWKDSWFSFTSPGHLPAPGEMMSSRLSLRHGWELAKSNGIIHAFLYYLNNIEETPELREKTELGLKYLSNPLKARMSGVASDPDESYGAFAVQATGFAGLSLAEGIEKNSVFNPLKN